MNLDSLFFALSHISYSVANLTKKNYKSSVAEISQLVARHGVEAERHLLRCLFSHVDFSGEGKSGGKDFHQTQYLIQECASLTTKPHFISSLTSAIDVPLHQQQTLKPSSSLLANLSRTLRLSRVQEVVFSLALQNSSNPETQKYSQNFVAQKLPHLIHSYTSTEGGLQEGGLQEAGVEVLHLLLTHLPHLSEETRDTFTQTLQRDFPRERVPVVLAPLLYPEAEDLPLEKLSGHSVTMPKSMMSSNLAEIIHELSYGFTNSVEECRLSLVQIGVKELTAASVARVLSMFARTPIRLNEPIGMQTLGSGAVWGDGKDKPDASGPQSWNVDIFVQVVKDLAPHLDWREVVSELDHPEFNLKQAAGLRHLVHALFRGLQDVFPIKLIYRPWKNSEGQLSWITQSLNNPDIFCFGDYPCHQVVTDILKSTPDEENREISPWKSLDLVELLMRMSDAGHYQAAMELFKFPLQQCPDILVLALLQIQMWNILKHELLSKVMPIFLSNHPNSAVVLQHAWHCNNQSTTIRTLVMHAMAEWYMRGEHHDQSRLSRILDVAQDLKALSMLLNATPYLFVIDLACLASRREYLKLDKWLADKVCEHQEPFVQACVNFLKRRCPQLVTGGSEEQATQSKSQQLPSETLTTLLTCMQTFSGGVTKDLSEQILGMINNASALLKARQVVAPQPPANMGPPTQSTPKSNLSQALPGLPSSVANLVNLPPVPTSQKPIMPPSLPGMPIPSSSLGSLQPQVDPLAIASMGLDLGPTPVSSVPAPIISAFATSLSSTLTGTPASPAKLFPALAQPGPPAQPFSHIASLTSQFQNIGMQPSMSTSAITARPTPSLGALTSQALKQPQGHTPLPADVSNILPAMNQHFSKEIEDEANSYFQRIYNHTPHLSISIDDLLDMLKRFKDSSDKKEADVFACMLRNLFEEYRFFPQYPEKELLTTAHIFGGIIEQGLVTYMDLGIALRYVLEALKKSHGSKMYYFGISALDKFKARLKDYPQYCQHLAGIPHFAQFPQHLREYIDFGGRSQEPPNRPQGPITTSGMTPVITATGTATSATTTTTTATPVTTSSTVSTTVTAPAQPMAIARPTTSSVQSRPSIASATSIETLLAGTEDKEDNVVPPEALQDKVFFIFNNLSLVNMDTKATELREYVSDEYVPWVARYLVMKRASIEHNFHTLYANFIDHLKINGFLPMVVSETYRNINVLLRSDKGVANFSDRSLLKNLGHWLGLLTLAKNKPILHVDIDLKSLLYEAYYKGSQELLYVVPFVAKVLESCAKSKVFKPPNPWCIAMMNVLAELHQETDLKLNLKFEIEVLCKNLNLDINDLKPAEYLKDTSRQTILVHQLSAPRASKGESSTPQPEEPLQINMPTPTTTAAIATIPTTTATTTAGPTSSVMAAPQPQFTYTEVTVSSLGGLSPHININDQIVLFQAHPQMRQLVRPAIERSVQELLPPVVERSIKIALTACEQIVKKDFALDPEETRTRVAAHHMVRFMTAGMALITCREPLLLSISTNIKTAFLTNLRGATQQQKDLIEQATTVIAQDNVELACAFIQKTAVEKAIPEMDKRLATEYDLRKHARQESRRYCDPQVLTYQAERMPEQIRLKVGGVTPHQIAVYEEFGRNIPGFMSSMQEATQNAQFFVKPMQSFATDEITQIYDEISAKIEQHLRLTVTQHGNMQVVAMRALLDSVLIARNSREIVTALSLLNKAVDGLLDGVSSLPGESELMMRYRDSHLMVLKGLQDHRAYGHQWTNKQVTKRLMESREENNRYNLEAIDYLIRSQLVNMQQYDLHIAQSMENGLSYTAVAFAMQLVQRFCVDDKHTSHNQEAVFHADFFNTIETLARIAAHSRQAPDGLSALIDAIRQHNDGGLLDRAPGGPTSMMHSGITQAREFDDPAGLHEKTDFLLREWVSMYHSPQAGRDSSKAFSTFVGQMHQQGILKTDDLITRFFRLCTEMCVDLCYRALAEPAQSPTLVRTKCFHTLDAFVRLIALLVKHSGDTTNTVTKINLLNKVLGIVAGVLLQDHEVRGHDFHQLPYHRIFIMLFIELNAPEHVLESINYQILTAFCNTFHILRPVKAPGFQYAWLELVSHRVFISRMLAITGQRVNQGWNMYAQLLIDLFKFLAPFLRNAELAKPTQLLYKGTLRVLLVLLHDFPEFLCDYHYAFCDVVPLNCIQLRNLILSAFPRSMRLPDPFTPKLKVDMLAEISHAPRIMTNFGSLIQPASFRKDLDSYLKTRSPVTFLSELRSNLQVSNEPGMRYNIPLLNALVVYVGTQAISVISSKSLTPSMTTIAHSSHMDIFQNLAVDLDTEGRYLFLNAIVNQLRYPNSHTHYFSCTLLYLFAEANTEAIQEQITRVLLERLIVNRPHPWGLLITFIELIKNPSYNFWNHEFVHCAPEIQKLLESVARSCMQPKQAQMFREADTLEVR